MPVNSVVIFLGCIALLGIVCIISSMVRDKDDDIFIDYPQFSTVLIVIVCVIYNIPCQ